MKMLFNYSDIVQLEPFESVDLLALREDIADNISFLSVAEMKKLISDTLIR